MYCFKSSAILAVFLVLLAQAFSIKSVKTLKPVKAVNTDLQLTEGDTGEQDVCYGPPEAAGGRVCESPKAVINFARVTYRVSPVKATSVMAKNAKVDMPTNSNKKVTVCCDGRGMIKNREFWVPLGCSDKEYSKTTFFDGVISFPAIRCSGIPEGAFVNWSVRSKKS